MHDVTSDNFPKTITLRGTQNPVWAHTVKPGSPPAVNFSSLAPNGLAKLVPKFDLRFSWSQRKPYLNTPTHSLCFMATH